MVVMRQRNYSSDRYLIALKLVVKNLSYFQNRSSQIELRINNALWVITEG